MSTLLRTLLALFAALAVCVAAWAGLCAAGIETARVAERADPVPTPPPDAPLLRALPRVPTAAEASAARAPRPRAGLRVGLRGQVPAESLVLTVFDGWSGAPIATAAVDAAALAVGSVTFPDLPGGRHRVTLANSAAGARHSYLTAMTVEAGDALTGGDLAGGDLVTSSGALSVLVRDSEGAPVADVVVTAERIDDPAWRCPPARTARTTHPLTDAAGRAALGPLGVGRYRIRAASRDSTAVEVEFPATTEATLTLRPVR